MTKAEELAALARGEGCIGKSQDDEPIFTLVARDKFAAAAVRRWAGEVMAGSGKTIDDPKIAEAMALAQQMDNWREAHGGGKVPD